MSHQDTKTKSAHLRHVTQWLLRGIKWDRPLHCNCTWTFPWLVSTALLWALSAEDSLKERFSVAQRLTIWLANNEKKETSMQAFVEILVRHTSYLRMKLLHACQERMARDFPQWMTQGFVVFGMDGSDIAVPRTKSNQAAFTTDGKSKHQKRKKKKSNHTDKLRGNPRILMTTLFHCALGLPWNWRLGSKSDNERSQLLDMLESLPKKALIVGDAGFVGYDFLSKIIAHHVDLIVRVGSNVTLLKQLGTVRQCEDLVYIWPNAAAKKSQPPLVFRLVVIQGGKHPIYLVTSVLEKNRLSDRHVAKIYGDRWGIELYHRHVKQTFGCHKMMSRKSENALIELQWMILGFLAMTLYAVSEFNKQGIPLEQMSAAGIILAFRQIIRDYLHPYDPKDTLNIKIHRALKDRYERTSSKTSRDYPRRRKHKSPGKPIIINATKQQRILAERTKNPSLAA